MQDSLATLKYQHVPLRIVARQRLLLPSSDGLLHLFNDAFNLTTIVPIQPLSLAPPMAHVVSVDELQNLRGTCYTQTDVHALLSPS